MNALLGSRVSEYPPFAVLRFVLDPRAVLRSILPPPRAGFRAVPVRHQDGTASKRPVSRTVFH